MPICLGARGVFRALLAYVRQPFFALGMVGLFAAAGGRRAIALLLFDQSSCPICGKGENCLKREDFGGFARKGVYFGK